MQYLLRMQQVSDSEQKSDFCIFFARFRALPQTDGFSLDLRRASRMRGVCRAFFDCLRRDAARLQPKLPSVRMGKGGKTCFSGHMYIM